MVRPRREDPHALRNVVGDRVRQARVAKHPAMDQIDLAASLSAALGLIYGRTTISRLESGHRPVMDYELIALAKILQVDLLWLLTGHPDGSGHTGHLVKPDKKNFQAESESQDSAQN
ncbi:MAG: helix-turn-helix transcriptional regulator [Candidatus Sericytochromatia bacterium]|nr:helix-turn-helix transcriptional regulator [Candidatus Sericytochromatia bacterium]